MINKILAGVDEVGRGCLAGPVISCALILRKSINKKFLKDSKTIPFKDRIKIAEHIKKNSWYAIGSASVKEIDELNILRASHLAMIRAINGLSIQPGHILIDGNMIPKGLIIPASAIIKGDSKSVSISAASIIAKVTRDKIMVDLGQHFTGYEWEKNAGYPTQRHISAIKTLGVTPHHRASFRPIHNILYQE